MDQNIITYEKILKMATTILESESFDSIRTLITYKLPKGLHLKLDEELFYRGGGEASNFEHTDIIEVEVADIMFNFIIE